MRLLDLMLSVRRRTTGLSHQEACLRARTAWPTDRWRDANGGLLAILPAPISYLPIREISVHAKGHGAEIVDAPAGWLIAFAWVEVTFVAVYYLMGLTILLTPEANGLRPLDVRTPLELLILFGAPILVAAGTSLVFWSLAVFSIPMWRRLQGAFAHGRG